MTKALGGRLRPAPSIGITIESPLWKAVPSLSATLRRAIKTAWSPDLENAEVAILLTDDEALRTLNRKWRGRDEPTDVLSFPSNRRGRKHATSVFLGDIAIAYGITAREAAAEGKLLHHHLTHLAVHGFLHLVGYDHESHDEAEAMESLERKILSRLGIPDPYAAHGAGITSGA